jgi:hypothetical protein
MLMLTRVVRALVSAQAASFCARLNHPFDDQLIRARPTRCDRSGRDTHIGAIEIEANALGQQRNHLLAQARICARRADLGAIVTSLDTPDQGVVNAAADMRMRGDHLLSMHAVSPYSAELQGSTHGPSDCFHGLATAFHWAPRLSVGFASRRHRRGYLAIGARRAEEQDAVAGARLDSNESMRLLNVAERGRVPKTEHFPMRATSGRETIGIAFETRCR